jgi:hypothetical protein
VPSSQASSNEKLGIDPLRKWVASWVRLNFLVPNLRMTSEDRRVVGASDARSQLEGHQMDEKRWSVTGITSVATAAIDFGQSRSGEYLQRRSTYV